MVLQYEKRDSHMSQWDDKYPSIGASRTWLSEDGGKTNRLVELVTVANRLIGSETIRICDSASHIPSNLYANDTQPRKRTCHTDHEH